MRQSILVTMRARVGLVAAIALTARIAAADSVGIVAAGEARGTVAAAMARAITAERARTIVPGAVEEARDAAAAGAVPAETLQRFRRVREQIKEGWDAYQRVDLGIAAERLAAARTDAEDIVTLPGGSVLYADAALKLGAVLGQLGRTEASQAAIALALALDPDRPITQLEFSPNVIQQVDAVRALTPTMQRARIVVDPSDAIVSVDGKDVGRAPFEGELSRGQHVVIARAPMYHAHAIAVAVDDASRDVSIELDRDDATTRLAGGAELGLTDRAQQELVDATLRFADVDEVIVVVETERRGGPTLLGQRCAGSPVLCSAVVEIGYADRAGLDAAARSVWQGVSNGELRYPPSVLRDARAGGIGGGGGPRCKLCHSGWLWGSVGAAAVVATIAIIVETSASKSPPILDLDPSKFGH